MRPGGKSVLVRLADDQAKAYDFDSVLVRDLQKRTVCSLLPRARQLKA